MKTKIVLTGGKFNKIHNGHLWLLKKAKAKGYLLVVLANASYNNREYAVSAATRKKNLEKLNIADKVVIGSSIDFCRVIEKYKPNLIVLGYDQKLPDKNTADLVKKMKIKTMKLRKFGNYRTRDMN